MPMSFLVRFASNVCSNASASLLALRILYDLQMRERLAAHASSKTEQLPVPRFCSPQLSKSRILPVES